MSFLNKIRTFDAKFPTCIFVIIIGFFFLFIGLFALFFNPSFFISYENTIIGINGASSISLLIMTLFGWTFFVYGILNILKWSKTEKIQTTKSNRFSKRIDKKNRIFIILTFIFILSTTSIFLIIRPAAEKIKKRNEELNNSLKEIQKQVNKIKQRKPIEKNIINNKNINKITKGVFKQYDSSIQRAKVVN